MDSAAAVLTMRFEECIFAHSGIHVLYFLVYTCSTCVYFVEAQKVVHSVNIKECRCICCSLSNKTFGFVRKSFGFKVELMAFFRERGQRHTFESLSSTRRLLYRTVPGKKEGTGLFSFNTAARQAR